MTLTDIHKQKEKYGKENSCYFRKFCLLVLVHFFLIIAGGCLFLYIEECFDPTPPVANRKNNDVICSEIHQLSNQSTAAGDVEFQQRLLNLTALCNEGDEIQDGKPGCVVNLHTFTKWSSFTMSICFTIGEFLFSPFRWIRNVLQQKQHPFRAI